MEKKNIEIPPDLLEKYGQPVDGFDFDKTVRNILSVPADAFPPVEELERRPKRKNGEGRAPRKTA